MVQKCMTSKGCWPEILPLFLFFLRLTPNAASGFSSFMLSYGWEPTTPSQVLYNAWVGKQLGDMSVEDWVADNCERIQQLRDEASANYIRVSEARKDKVDKTAQVRVFTVGQKVWYRTPGLSEALQPSWHGPYRVVKVAGPVSYVIDVEGKHRNVHVRFLKEHVEKVVKRITTTLDNDGEVDSVTDTNGKAHVEESVLDESRQRDLDEWVEEFTDVISLNPGLADGVEFAIDTGDAALVSQRP